MQVLIGIPGPNGLLQVSILVKSLGELLAIRPTSCARASSILESIHMELDAMFAIFTVEISSEMEHFGGMSKTSPEMVLPKM